MVHPPPLSQDEPSHEEGQQSSQEQNHQPTDPFQDSLPAHFTPSSDMKTYNLYYTTSMTNFRLHLGHSSGPCMYYGEFSYFTNKPQIQLREGDSKAAPMVAFAKLHFTSRNLLIGLGDYQKDPEERLVWEELRREKFRLQRSDYEFDTSVGSRARRTYSWRRDKEHLMKTVYRCVDDAGQVVVSMLSGGMLNWKKGGEIEIVQDLEKALEELLMVSAIAIWAAEAGWSVFKGYSSSAKKSSDGNSQ